MSTWIQVVLALLGAYLCGSLPFGLLVGWARGVDIRRAGSGNIGATNAGRVLGRPYGVLVFLLDMLKGCLPTFAAGHWLIPLDGGSMGGRLQPMDTIVWLMIAGATIIGHIAPVWLGFRGGKGVATGWGALMGIYPYFTLPGIAILLIWVLTTLATRYVSVGSIVASASFPLIFALVAHERAESWGSWADLWPLHVFGTAVAGLVVYRHRTNLRRLWAGTEPRIGASRAAPTSGPAAPTVVEQKTL